VTQTVEGTQDELARRHRAAVLVVGAMIALTLLLMLLAQTSLFEESLEPNPQLGGSLRIVTALFAAGALLYRRTKFSAMRLQDIAALRGMTGLLRTLQTTTVNVAFIGGAIAVMGYVVRLLTGATSDKWFGVVALAVLFYAYPRRAAWQRVVDATEQPSPGASTTAKGTTA
jgi:hypothetical protein